MGVPFRIRDLRGDEAAAFGDLLVSVYAALEGFPSLTAQPDYYALLARAGDLALHAGVRVLVALAPDGTLLGGVVYFGDLAAYGATAAVAARRGSAGMRLLAVAPQARGSGVGRALTLACIGLACADGRAELLLHTTRAMRSAWALYGTLGFTRLPALDFDQSGLPVHGFRLGLPATCPDLDPFWRLPGLPDLLCSLRPRLAAATYAYARLESPEAATALAPLALFREDEGVTVVVPADSAERAGLAVAFRAGWITLGVDSALDGLGLTAAVASMLAANGIACNVIAALQHDHLFVPEAQAEAALACLVALQARALLRSRVEDAGAGQR